MFEEELKNRITKYLEASGARISFICSKETLNKGSS